MDPNELIAHAPDLLKGGAALAGALKLTDIVKAMLGPATAEIAERFRDEVRRYRYGRQLECLRKAEKMATDAGFTPKAVPIKILFPLLEGASLEEDEDLHTMWAALLANAASPAKSSNVRPGFAAILKQMSPHEAVLLKAFAEIVDQNGVLHSEYWGSATKSWDGLISAPHMRERLDRLGWIPENSASFRTSLLLLAREGLVRSQGFAVLTSLGRTFLECCEPPKPIS